MNAKIKRNIKGALVGGTLGLILALCGEISRRPNENIYDPKPIEVSEITHEIHRVTAPTTESATESATEQETTDFKLCDVPMSTDLQEWLFNYCEEIHISPYLVIAICERESDFDANCVYDNGNSIGIMQIQPKWHGERMERLGVEDLTDAKSNIKVGIDFLLELFNENDNLAWVLMAYNGGHAYAYRKINNGEISDYAQSIIDRCYSLERGV